MQRIFSGVQPSGNLTIGNYIGALKQWAKLQNSETYECFFCIVDLHALTVKQNPTILRKKILEVAKLYLAAGIDPARSTIFVQSAVHAHTELSWILGTQTKISELERMTQFKDKALKNKSNIYAGLLTYPILMAADILLYQTNLVPVGEDQKQHLELTRTLAERFNRQFGTMFSLPEAYIPKQGARIMGLDDPTKKMSKSSNIPAHAIALTDSPDTIRKKIARAVTDSGSEIKSGKEKPAITNLLAIYSATTNRPVPEIEKEYIGKGYREFKQGLTEAVISFLKPLQQTFISLSDSQVESYLQEGKEKAKAVAQKTLETVHHAIGLR